MDIKTCPHCGGNGGLVQSYNYKSKTFFVCVKCEVCGAQGRAYKCESEPAADGWESQPCQYAVNAWNLRNKAADETPD